MKISSKIMSLIVILLVVLAINGLISFRLLKGVGEELQTVVKKDLVLMETSTSVTKHQLQKAIIFERLRRIAEELAYQQVTPARKEHLVFHSKLARNDFDVLAKEGAINIVNGKLLVDESIRYAKNVKTREDLQRVAAVLKEIEKAHIHYDAMAGEAFSAVKEGRYEISPEDINQIHTDERKLSNELEKLLNEVQSFTQKSMANAKEYEKTTELVLWTIFILSLLIGLGLAWSIIRSINRPLGSLLKATHEIGGGNLSVKLDESSRDELGDLSREFNRMSGQLSEARTKLEEQSKVLRYNLDLTAQQKKDLEKVNQELDRFVHTVSHDIRSPLMGIAWYADFLKNHHYDALDQKGRDSVEGICRGVDRANALIKDLLDLTRISRVRNPYQRASVKAMLDDVLANLEYKIKQNQVDLKVQSGLPDIVCDPIKLKEVFLNLLTNAMKFASGRMGVQPSVIIEMQEMSDAYEFIVKDNGIGIAPEHHQEVFEIFKRLDVSEKYEGTGAGLSIVKSVIDDHGGKIWIISDVGQGAEFHFTIPKGLSVS
jgi:signal transduction histidine kinase